ncbi:FAD-containing monooxygenase EthA [Gammaproteobacteria bacterium 42_54_T18]|nr:FAD-containing monooxygenase EthA [Gammaproteobacteria bacterium 42_54_T18]
MNPSSSVSTDNSNPDSFEKLDVLIVGAGLSGISAAYYVQKHCPDKTFAVLEGRENLGGTWDLFRYPGIRSDSDMYTLGYEFKPWATEQSIASGPSIREYIRETAQEYNITGKIRYQQKATAFNWSSENAEWTVDVEQADGSVKKIRSNFVMMCVGYYNYETAHAPDFKGEDDFEGKLIHPQFWPKDFDYSNKKVVVIGSGATAVTLVPAMTDKAEHVTMLQRTPTFMGVIPTKDRLANALRKWLPEKLAYRITRTRKIIFFILMYSFSKRFPKIIKGLMLKLVSVKLKDKSLIRKHFTPKYNPWDQRVCAVTDGDLFDGINKGKISVETDHIDRFTKSGILLRSGKELEADVIVTATGLKLSDPSSYNVSVDGKMSDFSQRLVYKGMMCNDIPNLSVTMGYTNASWTLKADLIHAYFCRLINHLDNNGLDYFVPVNKNPQLKKEAGIDFQSGYVLRASSYLPKQGDQKPWKLDQNYVMDLMSLRFRDIHDDAMQFMKAGQSVPTSVEVDDMPVDGVANN